MQIETGNHIIRLGEVSDIPAMQEFIAKEWNPDHIFVKSRAFFEYEHVVNEKFNGLLAISKESGQLDGILLFYQNQLERNGSDMWGGIWRVRGECNTPFLGMMLIKSVQQLTGIRSHNGVGINPSSTGLIFKRLPNQTVDQLSHYYRLSDRENYHVATIVEKKILPVGVPQNRLLRLFSLDEVNNCFVLPGYEEHFPHKDIWYLEHRYFKHPIYTYFVYGVKVDNSVKALLVAREVSYHGAMILRVVDFIGDSNALSDLGGDFQQLMDAQQYEYIDFYELGVPDATMQSCGFTLNAPEDGNIIPNYFEPFVNENITLWCHTPFQEKMYIFKGDGDQDRPNLLS